MLSLQTYIKNTIQKIQMVIARVLKTIIRKKKSQKKNPQMNLKVRQMMTVTIWGCLLAEKL